MELAYAIYVFNHSLLAIISGVFALQVDDSDALSYLVATLALLLCLLHISFLSVKPIFKSLVEEQLGAWAHHIVVAHDRFAAQGVPFGWCAGCGKVYRLDLDVIVLVEHLA